MGQNQQQPNSDDPNKPHPVVFSFPVDDDGVVPDDCMKIFLVSSKEEFLAPESFVIEPVDLNGFFIDETIYGYEGLKINAWVSSISFDSYADITYQSSSDRGKGITDLKRALQRIFGGTLVESKDEFLQSFLEAKNLISIIISRGEVLQHKVFNGHIGDPTRHADSANSNVEVVRLVPGSMAAKCLYSRLIPLVLLLVDVSIPIQVKDPNWELYVVAQKETDQQGEIQCRFIGFTAVDRCYHYPDSTRLRLGQILVLPPYQHKGYGRYILEVLNDVAISENVFDLTVEEPVVDRFQHIRACVDVPRLLRCDAIQKSVKAAVSLLKQGKLAKKAHGSRLMPPSSAVEYARKALKINKKQFLRCWEVSIYLGLNPSDKHMDDFSSIISNRVKYDILRKDYGTSGKQLIEVPSEFSPKRSFVMFRSAANEANKINNQTIGEGPLQELVQVLAHRTERRVKEIQLIAEKVTLHRESSEVAVN